MSTDHKRLDELERSKGTLQYGQNLQIAPAPGNPDLVIASKDLIRFVGDKTDINSLRVYLSPWQPRNGIPIPAGLVAETYADPTPWAPPEPRNHDAMLDVPLYARVMFGAGGIQHTAYVDWPMRGLLFQVGGSYLQVNAFVDVGSPAVDPLVLPLVSATLAPEPGGGDSLAPATFTYRPQNTIAVVGPTFIRNFQIPPFARSFVLLFPTFEAVVGMTLRVAVQRQAAPIGTGFDTQQWFSAAATTADTQRFTIDPFPISGQQSANVRIEVSGGVFLGRFGCMFQLDM